MLEKKFTQQELNKLLNSEPLIDMWPWNSNDNDVINKYYNKIRSSIGNKLHLDSKVEFDYGSGFASYIDVWYYKEIDELRESTHFHSYYGLVVLFNKFSNFYALGEGIKSWDLEKETGSSYLPELTIIDSFSKEKIRELSKLVESSLVELNFIRLYKENLEANIDKNIIIETNLSDPPYKIFDVLFNWMD